LRTGIGLALIDTTAGVEEGAELTVDVRGRPQAVEVVRPPFVPSHVR
jgi:aminomethyltransferase